jgi:hypothetical protein
VVDDLDPARRQAVDAVDDAAEDRRLAVGQLDDQLEGRLRGASLVTTRPNVSPSSLLPPL